VYQLDKGLDGSQSQSEPDIEREKFLSLLGIKSASSSRLLGEEYNFVSFDRHGQKHMYEHNTEILENEIARYREDDHFGPLN
jgi:hypothetical protein